jgi:DNA-directed RNA polymerase subunit RPC12/RpoP
MNDYPCLFCIKKFEEFEELMHHMNLEHVGIDKKRLQYATQARETKKQLGDYVGKGPEGVSYECPECFEIFPDIEKVNEHRKAIHQQQFTKEAEKKLRELPSFDEKNPPQCEKCKRLFFGLVVCKMDGKAMSVCFSCYENHYGINALRRLTIGTPDYIIEKMRKPFN